jgi:hypothetical protein
MEPLVNIRLDLGIDARKFVQQVQLQNGIIEKQVEKGIELALNDICESDNFIQAVRENAKIELSNIVHKIAFSWDMKRNIEKLISEKVGKKIEEYADKITEKITTSLND